MGLLDGRKILVSGVAFRGGIGTTTVDEIRQQGGVPVITCHPDQAKRAEKYRQGDEVVIPCDFSSEDSVDDMCAKLRWAGHRIDGFLHSVANAPASLRQEDRDFLSETTDEFMEGLRLNALSFHWLTKYLMGKGNPELRILNDGAVGVAMTFMLGVEKYIEFYWQMAPAKALLNGIALYLAGNVGKHGVRIHLLDAGPIDTMAAKGVGNFQSLYEAVPHAVPLGANTEAGDVARHIAWLMSPFSVGAPLVHTVDHGLCDQGVVPVRDPRQQ